MKSIEDIAHILYDLVELRYSTKEIVQNLEASIGLKVGYHNREELEILVSKYKFSRTGLEKTAEKLRFMVASQPKEEDFEQVSGILRLMKGPFNP